MPSGIRETERIHGVLIKPGVRGSRKELETEFEKLTAAHDERTNELAESLRWIRSGKHVLQYSGHQEMRIEQTVHETEISC